jgi:hypothetical protein
VIDSLLELYFGYLYIVPVALAGLAVSAFGAAGAPAWVVGMFLSIFVAVVLAGVAAAWRDSR